MSEVAALVPLGESHSALFYRDLFLHDETRYEPFWCPFCGIKLFAVLVYEPADAELAKSPHFRKSEAHWHGCDGNPAQAKKSRGSHEPVSIVEKQPFTLPTRLIDYVERPPRVDPLQPVPMPTAEEVKKRRAEAGQHHHRARFSVALVQSVAEAHLGTVGRAYELQREKKWSNEQRQAWLSAIFETEIDLRGTALKYKAALHDLYFPVRQSPRIYHSEGTVSAIDGDYVISASQQGKLNDTDKAGRPFVVKVSGCDSVALRGARRELMVQLQRAAKQQLTVKWYGYGLPVCMTDRFELRFDIDNLSDLFVRRKSAAAVSKRPQQQPSGQVQTMASTAEPAGGRPMQSLPGSAVIAKTRQDSPAPGPERSAQAAVPSLAPVVKVEERPAAPVPSVVPKRPEPPARSRPALEVLGTDAHRDAWSEAVRQEYDMYCVEQTEAARKLAADYRTNTLNPHLGRKPWLWGKSAWKATLAEFEAVDKQNVARWERLKRNELTAEEAGRAKNEAVRRVKLKRPEFSQIA